MGPWPCAPPPLNPQVLSGNELQGLLSQFQHKHSLLLKVKQQQSKTKQNNKMPLISEARQRQWRAEAAAIRFPSAVSSWEIAKVFFSASNL